MRQLSLKQYIRLFEYFMNEDVNSKIKTRPIYFIQPDGKVVDAAKLDSSQIERFEAQEYGYNKGWICVSTFSNPHEIEIKFNKRNVSNNSIMALVTLLKSIDADEYFIDVNPETKGDYIIKNDLRSIQYFLSELPKQ